MKKQKSIQCEWKTKYKVKEYGERERRCKETVILRPALGGQWREFVGVVI
jgi:hypothetical protein